MISDIILLEQHSDDVLFSFAHWFSFSSSHKKSASCVIFIISQLTAFLQTFFSVGLSSFIIHYFGDLHNIWEKTYLFFEYSF